MQKHFYDFKEFSGIPGLIHGFSTSYFGGMSDADFKRNTLKNFLEELGIEENQVVRMSQVHSNSVQVVSKKEYGKAMADTDAIVTKDNNVFLCVRTADCLPIIMYDPVAKVVAAAHAGWRGANGNIASEVVMKMESLGSLPQNILIGIGPAIHACCYEVDTKRKELFMENYKKWEDLIFTGRDGKIYLDLPALVQLQLVEVGVAKENITISDMCTYDSDDFFSYRKEKDKTKVRRFAGIIGMI